MNFLMIWVVPKLKAYILICWLYIKAIVLDKMLFFFFQSKSIDIFPILPWKHMLWVLIRSALPRCFYPQHKFFSSWKHILWYSVEAPQQGASTEYPQHMFSWRNTKNIYLIPPPHPYLHLWKQITFKKIFFLFFSENDTWHFIQIVSVRIKISGPLELLVLYIKCEQKFHLKAARLCWMLCIFRVFHEQTEIIFDFSAFPKNPYFRIHVYYIAYYIYIKMYALVIYVLPQ